MLRSEAGAVLLDIEGTISPIAFVRDVLFAYSRERLAGFVAERRDDPVVAEILEQARALSGGGDPVTALTGWQDRDEKVPPLKKLQGLIWEAGYRDGAFRSPLFGDVLPTLSRWIAGGLPLYIYSSGSVQAQLLFFEFNDADDLRPLFSGHFDTEIGAKTEAASYERIAERIGVEPNLIVFFSDSGKELAAAQEAGLQVVRVVKDGAEPEAQFAEISDFGQVAITRVGAPSYATA